MLIFSALLTSMLCSQIDTGIKYKLIDKNTYEINLIKFVRLEKKGSSFYIRDEVYAIPKNIKKDIRNSFCGDFIFAIPLHQNSYLSLSWYLINEDSVNNHGKKANFFKYLSYDQNSLNINGYPYNGYPSVVNDTLPLYTYNDYILFSIQKVQIKGLLVYFQDIQKMEFYSLYSSWGNLINNSCTKDNVYFFITEVIKKLDIEESSSFSKYKIFNKKIYKIAER